MKKIMMLLVSLATLTLLFIGCELETIQHKEFPTLNNDLESGSLELRHNVGGFVFVTRYSTSYNIKNWHITDSKMLDMKAQTVGADAYIVMVEHVHIDTALQSIYESLNGWTTDSMDDKLAVGLQPGFLISDKYYYQNIFAIEGYSDRLISGWQFYCSGYGAGSITEHRLTEDALVEHGGVYGQKVQVVYDLLVKTYDEDYFHTYSLIDEFVIPVKTD